MHHQAFALQTTTTRFTSDFGCSHKNCKLHKRKGFQESWLFTLYFELYIFYLQYIVLLFSTDDVLTSYALCCPTEI